MVLEPLEACGSVKTSTSILHKRCFRLYLWTLSFSTRCCYRDQLFVHRHFLFKQSDALLSLHPITITKCFSKWRTFFSKFLTEGSFSVCSVVMDVIIKMKLFRNSEMFKIVNFKNFKRFLPIFVKNIINAILAYKI